MITPSGIGHIPRSGKPMVCKSILKLNLKLDDMMRELDQVPKLRRTPNAVIIHRQI